jgi:DNA gyrase inhibitor GyrI
VKFVSILRNLLGPKSKYDRSIPYTYEARVAIIEGDEDYNAYFADTVCSLVEYLDQKSIKPAEVEIFEIYQDREKGIKHDLYSTEAGAWLKREQMCQSFKQLYDGHIHSGGCTFEDRVFEGISPKTGR